MKKTIIAINLVVCLLTTTVPLFAQTRGAGNVKVKKDDGKIEEIKLYEASYTVVVGDNFQKFV